MLCPVPCYPQKFQSTEARPLLIPFLQSVQGVHVLHIRHPIARIILVSFGLDALLQQVFSCASGTARATLAFQGRELGVITIEVSISN